MENYMHTMKKAHMGYLRKMMKAHEAKIAEIQNSEPLNEVAPALMALGTAAAQGAGQQFANNLMPNKGMKKMGGKSKGKKGKKMKNENLETHDEFLTSLSRGAHNELGTKYGDGLSEDAVFAAQNPNDGLGDIDPGAGDVGFAPQGRVGGAQGAGGYTQDDVNQIPMLGESFQEPETDEELDEWMDIAFGFGGLTESANAPAKSTVKEGSYMHGDDGDEEEGCPPDCDCKKCMKMKKMKVKKDIGNNGVEENKKHCNESVDFFTSLKNGAKRTNSGW
jgi:hypothetical protein